jgi:hypothetical protein
VAAASGGKGKLIHDDFQYGAFSLAAFSFE